ncbi:STAS domain-containing protein [Nakamurella deserti]|uniref:STAS domain-containing protein n=1 Tax=Nakamurella deserti TaxID=2164074 RepID=UPI0013002A1D|nr:STAS domain-containing protein [Nakamurella deserti]
MTTAVTAGNTATAVVAGRLDAVAAPELHEALAGLLADGYPHLTVDLSDVTFVDSAGLAVLVRSRRETRLQDGDVVLVGPRSVDATRVFRLTQFDRVFTILPPAPVATS